MDSEIKNTLSQYFYKKKIQIEKLHGDASGRVYYRIFHGRKSDICCLYKNEGQAFLHFTKIYQNFGLNTPKVYLHDQNLKIIIQEDIGHISLQKYLITSKNKALYKKCIQELIKIQKIPTTKDIFLKKTQDFDISLYQKEINITNTYFIEKFLKISDQLIQKKINKSFNPILLKLENTQKKWPVFTHRDFHSRNIYIKEKKVYLIDYQDSRRGNLCYDLASLLEDPYHWQEERIKNECIDFFYKNSPHTPFTYKSFLKLYKFSAIQRLYKAIGTFCMVYYRKKSPYYLRYIDTSIHQIINLSSNHKETRPIADILTKLYYDK